VRLKETKVRVTVKLSALRDAKTPCIPCANKGIKAAIKPQKNETPKAKGCPAWSDNVRG